MKLTEQQQDSRDKLKESKPLVHDKIMNKGNQPRLQYQYRYTCNYKCSHCSIENVKDKTKKLMDLSDTRKLFDQADEIGISRVTITGGEPLTFNRLDLLIDAIGSKRFYLQLDTNGHLLTREKTKQLKEWGIDCIAPSLDSLNKQEHDSFRNVLGSANKVLKAFDYIQEEGLNTFVQTVVTKTRLYSKEFIRFIEYFNNRDIGVFVSFAKPVGAYEGNFDELVEKEDFKYIKELESKYKIFTHLTPAYGENKERKCIASKNIFGVTSYGEMISCIYCYVSMGNVRDEPLKDLLNRAQRLKPFDKKTCVMADKSDNFIEDYLVKKVYGKKLPVPYTDVFTDKNFK